MLTGRADPEAEAPILWPSHEKRRLPGKDPDVGKVWGQEEKGTTEDEMVGHVTKATKMNLTQLREAVEDRRAWRALVLGGHEESDTTKRLNENEEISRLGLQPPHSTPVHSSSLFSDILTITSLTIL